MTENFGKFVNFLVFCVVRRQSVEVLNVRLQRQPNQMSQLTISRP